MKYYKVITLDPSKVVTYCKCHPRDFLYCSLSSLYPHSFWPNCLGFVNQDWCRVIQFAFPPKKNYPFQFNVTTVNWPGKLPFLWLQKSFLEANLIWDNKKQSTNILTKLSFCVYLLSQLLFVYKYDFQIIVDNHTFLTTVDFHIITWWPTLQKSINSKFEIMSNKYLYNLSID